MRKVLLSRISFSALMLTFLTLFLFFSFSSSLEVSQWDKEKPSGNITNEYINNTYINQTLELNTTQFETGEPATIKTSWLAQIIEGVSKWMDYYTITEIDNRYSNNTGDQNLSTYVQGNMSSETTTTYTPTNGSALSFDGVNDYVAVGTNLIFDYPTISAWVKTGSTARQTIIARHTEVPGQYGFIFELYNNQLRISYSLSGSDWYTDLASFNYADEEWHQYSFSYNGNYLNIYIDGSIVNTSIQRVGAFYNSNYNGYIGLRKTTHQTLAYFNGSIDEVLIFNRSLNSTEVSQLYNSGVGLYANTSIAPFNSGLVSGWHFDEGSGTTAYDLTGANNGTLTNSPSWVDGKVPHNIVTQVLGAIGLMPWVSATNFISTDFSLQWIGNALKNPWNIISTLGNSTNRWNVHLNNVTMNGTQGWSGNCINSSILNGIIVGCND